MTATTVAEVHQSRFGYHPCDYQTFLKLKEAHWLLYRAYCQCKRFRNWDCKYNKDRPEPPYPKHFLELGMHRLDKHSFYGYGFRRYHCCGSAENYYLHILRQYRKARMPQPTPELVLQLDIPADLDAVVADLKEYFNE